MKWSEVVDNPMFTNLPFKIELTRFGKLLMSPASNAHGRMQSRISAYLLQRRPDGEVITECSIATADGVKVADIAWLSSDFVAKYGFATPYPAAPELCIEILSPSNTWVEMRDKVTCYLNAGAQEVWLVHNLERIDIYHHEGPSHYSLFIPAPLMLDSR